MTFRQTDGDTPSDGADGVVLETPGERGDTPLSHVDSAVVVKSRVYGEEWTRVVGGTEFGVAVWHLVPDVQMSSVPPLGNTMWITSGTVTEMPHSLTIPVRG